MLQEVAFVLGSVGTEETLKLWLLSTLVLSVPDQCFEPLRVFPTRHTSCTFSDTKHSLILKAETRFVKTYLI